MDTPYGLGLDPTPYVAAAYGLGAIAILGFIFYNLWQLRRLREQLAALAVAPRAPHSS